MSEMGRFRLANSVALPGAPISVTMTDGVLLVHCTGGSVLVRGRVRSDELDSLGTQDETGDSGRPLSQRTAVCDLPSQRSESTDTRLFEYALFFSSRPRERDS